MWGAWQIGQMTKEDYAKHAYQWAKALKLADPSIELILCGCEGISGWDYHVLKECITYNVQALGNEGCLIEMHSIHLYTASGDHLQNAVGKYICPSLAQQLASLTLSYLSLAPRAAERAIELTGAMIDLAHIENKIPAGVRKQKICFDEWNVWDSKRAPGRTGAEEW